jgi:hypothetical protein
MSQTLAGSADPVAAAAGSAVCTTGMAAKGARTVAPANSRRLNFMAISGFRVGA